MSVMPIRGILLVAAVTLSACGSGGGGSNSGPTAPSGTSSTGPSAATTLSSAGCSVTYSCPNVDVNGTASPTTPTFDSLTVTNGTSSSCRADIYRNSPSPLVPVEFTVRNPQRDYFWATFGSQVSAENAQDRSVSTAGPHRTNVTNFAGPNFSSGQTITQTLTLSIRRSSSPEGPVVAQCSVAMWGFVVPGR
jgi:hypothetical protein